MRMAREEDGRCVNSSVVSQHGSLDAGPSSYGDKDRHPGFHDARIGDLGAGQICLCFSFRGELADTIDNASRARSNLASRLILHGVGHL